MRITTSGAARVLVLCGAAVAAAACEPGGERRFLSLGTGGTGGVYYPLGGALASRLSAADPHRTWTAEVTGGSVENINRVLRGEIDIGFAIGTSAYEAYHGGPDTPVPDTRLRIVAPLYPNLTHILVPVGSAVASVEGLRGRRVSVGSGGSGTEQVARHALEAYGLSYRDVQPRYLSFSESSAALADRSIDAAILSVGYPASAVLEAIASGSSRLLPMEPARVEAMAAAHAFYTPAAIPAGAYPGVDAPLPTTAVLNWLVARDDLDDDVVRAVLRLLRDERETLRRTVDIAGGIDLARLADAPIPLHRAAAAWLDGR
jgi:TRAP transporter TAXI family solute receptor